MDVDHEDPDLERLEKDPAFNMGFAENIVKGYRKVMGVLRAVKHERELANWRSLNFKRMKGKRQDEWSVRINDQWRLILDVEQGPEGSKLITKKIEDPH